MVAPQLKVLGLSGAAGAGKTEIAKHLVEKHGWLEFSFSDPLYAEVADAFATSIKLLQDRETKDTSTAVMSLIYCTNLNFVNVCIEQRLVSSVFERLSPRKILQWWGTEFRRAQDEDYWVKKIGKWYSDLLDDIHEGRKIAPEGVVNTSTRFRNELSWILSHNGVVWGVTRPDGMINDNPTHISEHELSEYHPKFAIVNDGGIEDLRTKVDNLLPLA